MLQVIRPIERLTILGMGRSINDWIAARYSSLTDYGEVWTVNAGGLIFAHDVLWDMHTERYICDMPEADRDRVLRRRERYQAHDKPIVLPQALSHYPTSVTFPLGEVVDRTQSNYFNNGMAYMLATAYCCKVKKLYLFGVDFFGSQYEKERACTMYWLGRLMESGCWIGGAATEVVDAPRRQSGAIYGYHEPIMFEYGGVEPKFVGPDYRGE